MYQKSNSVGRDIKLSANVCRSNWWKRKDQMKKRKQKSVQGNESKSKREEKRSEGKETHAR